MTPAAGSTSPAVSQSSKPKSSSNGYKPKGGHKGKGKGNKAGNKGKGKGKGGNKGKNGSGSPANKSSSGRSPKNDDKPNDNPDQPNFSQLKHEFEEILGLSDLTLEEATNALRIYHPTWTWEDDQLELAYLAVRDGVGNHDGRRASIESNFAMTFSHNANKAKRKLAARRRRHAKMREACLNANANAKEESVVPTDEEVIDELNNLKYFEAHAGWRTVLPVAKQSHPTWRISEKRFRQLWRKVKDSDTGESSPNNPDSGLSVPVIQLEDSFHGDQEEKGRRASTSFVNFTMVNDDN